MTSTFFSNFIQASTVTPYLPVYDGTVCKSTPFNTTDNMLLKPTQARSADG